MGHDGLPGPRHRLLRQERAEGPLRRHHARELPAHHGDLLLLVHRSRQARRRADAERRQHDHADLQRRRPRHAELQRDGRGQGRRWNRRCAISRSISGRRKSASTRSRPARSARWPAPASTTRATCSRSSSAIRRSAAACRWRTSAARGSICCPNCPAASPAKSTSSIPATTSSPCRSRTRCAARPTSQGRRAVVVRDFHRTQSSSWPGLIPAIHRLAYDAIARRGCPAQGRAMTSEVASRTKAMPAALDQHLRRHHRRRRPSRPGARLLSREMRARHPAGRPPAAIRRRAGHRGGDRAGLLSQPAFDQSFPHQRDALVQGSEPRRPRRTTSRRATSSASRISTARR